MEEQWRDVVGFEGIYKVSNLGRLYKLSNGNRPSQFMSLNTYDKDGYIKTALRKNGQRHYLRVHRLVAEAFIPNNEECPVVNHINGIKDDNRLENLEWCSISYNTQHAFDKLGRVGHNGNTNLSVEMLDNSTLRSIRTFESILEASEFVGVSSSAICQALKSENRTSAVYKWRYCDKSVTTIESDSKVNNI